GRRRRKRGVELLQSGDEVGAGAIELQPVAGGGGLALERRPLARRRAPGALGQPRGQLLILANSRVQVGRRRSTGRLGRGRGRLASQRGGLGARDVEGAVKDRQRGLSVLARVGEA